MAQSFFEKVKSCLNPSELASVICESLSRSETIRLMTADGISYPGVRMESIDHVELALDWIEEAWADFGVFSNLQKALDRAHALDIENIRVSSIDQLRQMIISVPQICKQRPVGGLIWAFLKDERAETAALLRPFLDAFYRYLGKQAKKEEKFEKLTDHLRQGRLNKQETEKVKDMLFKIMARNKEIEELRQREMKDQEKLRAHVQDLKNKLAQQESQITALKSEINGLRKKSADKDALIGKLEQNLKTISRDEEESLHRRIHELERNERIMTHDRDD